jgi:carbamoyltransferase
MRRMKILGISAFYHDAAAALIDGGEIVAAAQEERFTRRKHDPSFPANAIRYCLDASGTAFEDLPEDWKCPCCGASKKMFKKIDG